jgi:hypothetical protein
MIYLKWLALCLLDWVLLLTVPIAAPVVALLTREGSHLDPVYNWGWIWGTYDNPPQGDEGFVRKRSLFPGITTGFKGYLNRIHWMIRNPLYGYARISSVRWTAAHQVTVRGNPDISDKRMIPGWLYATATDVSGKVVAFELYVVAPWSKTRDLRMRLGWKITTDKVHEYGFAQLVNTINPFDGYGS